MRNKLNVGLVGASGNLFNTQRAKRDFEESTHMFQKLSAEKGFDLTVISQSLETPEDAQKALNILQDKKVDFLMIQTNTASNGDIAKILGTMDVNFGIWALPEPDMNELPMASVTAMNMYGAIWTHFFKNRKILYKWFFGPARDSQFQKRLDSTITVLSTTKSLCNSRIGLIGDVALGFYDVYFDERTLHSKWGVTVCKHEVREVVSRAKQVALSEVERISATLLPKDRCKNLSNKDTEKTIRVYLAFKQIVEEGNYDALAVRCWPEFQQEYEFAVCASASLLGGDGIPVACEGDVMGALSMLILHYLNNDTPTVMMTDLTTVDPKDDSMLMWHCGYAPPSWAREGEGTYCPHSLFGLGTVHDVAFAPQPTTIASLAEDAETILVATADIMNKDKPSYRGGRGWFHKVKVNGKPVTIFDLLETLMVNGFTHHFAITPGNIESYLDELVFWKALKYLPPKSYRE